MARPLRPEVEDGIYHVYNRGNAQQPIFEDNEDRTRFLSTFRGVRRLCGWQCLSYIISGIWVPTDSLSSGLRQVAKIFPVEHLSALLHQAYVPGTTGGHIAGGDLLVLAAWAAAAALFAARRFSWLPAPA